MKRLALLTLLVAGFATQAAAQSPQTREGFWISLGWVQAPPVRAATYTR